LAAELAPVQLDLQIEPLTSRVGSRRGSRSALFWFSAQSLRVGAMQWLSWVCRVRCDAIRLSSESACGLQMAPSSLGAKKEDHRSTRDEGWASFSIWVSKIRLANADGSARLPERTTPTGRPGRSPGSAVVKEKPEAPSSLLPAMVIPRPRICPASKKGRIEGRKKPRRDVHRT
jgi:hypothetical protein